LLQEPVRKLRRQFNGSVDGGNEQDATHVEVFVAVTKIIAL
jgi:hypothetical protein